MNTLFKKTVPFILALVVAVGFGFMDPATAASKPGKVKSFSVTKVTKNSVSLKWNKAKKANKYKVAYKAKGSKKWNYSTFKSKKKKVTRRINNLKADTVYYVKIKAYKGKKSSKWSKTKTIKTLSPTGDTGDSEGDSDPQGGGTPGDPGNTNYTIEGFLEVPEDTNVTLSYGSTTIHLGQKWTTSVKNGLSSGASNTTFICRKNYAIFEQSKVAPLGYSYDLERKIADENVYMFDTGDYDNFLIVYVTGGRISKWVTCAQNMGKNGSASLTRGKTSSFPDKSYRMYSNRCSEVSSVTKNGVLFGGFRQTGWLTDEASIDVEKEKTIGFHCINALRVLAGRSILIYNNYLDGKQMTYTGPYGPLVDGGTNWNECEYYATNQRYGAQALTDTMFASKQCSDDSWGLTQGPLAGIKGDDHDLITCASYAAGQPVRARGSNASMGWSTGEGAMAAHEGSPIHVWTMLANYNKYVGIGITGKYHNEVFGVDKLSDIF